MKAPAEVIGSDNVRALQEAGYAVVAKCDAAGSVDLSRAPVVRETIPGLHGHAFCIKDALGRAT